jgi:broad specificity phosphatase PhoE
MGTPSSDTERRKRRRRRRIQIVVVYTAIAIGLAWFFESQATTTVIFVRHAEKAAMPADDPGLSPAGERRVAELTRQLVDADVVAGIDAVYSTPFRRTEETVRPVAEALGLPVNSYDAADTEAIMEHIVREHKGKIILVVGHSNTLPALIGNMGASKKVPKIAENEYDNIYIVSIPWFGKTKTIRLRYGEPYIP